MAAAKYISMDTEVFFYLLELDFNTGRFIYIFMYLFVYLLI